MSKHIASVDELTEMQVYIGREMIEEYRAGQINRRTLLKRLTMICGGAMGGSVLLAACGDKENAGMIMMSPDAATAGGPDGGAAGGTTDARPPGALSVPPDDPAVVGTRVQYDSTGGKVTAYLARPKAAGSYPGVIVIHENRGLNDHIRDVARRLAKANFIALAPDLTSRGGSTEMLDPDMARTYLGSAPAADLVADLSAGVTFLGQQSGVSPADRLGVVGFCYGGGMTYRLTAANPKIVASVPYYGPIQQDVIDQLRTANAAILIQHAQTDGVNSTTDALVMALMGAGKTYKLLTHPGTNHAFNNDTGANYNETAAVAAWTETVGWFNTHLRR